MGAWGAIRSALLVALLAAAAAQEVTDDDDDLTELTYSLTVRDFLPSYCMNESEYRFALNTAQGYFGLRAVDYARRSLPADMGASGDYDIFQAQNYDSLTPATAFRWNTYCPYFEYMADGLISGHPDFEPRISPNGGLGETADFVFGPMGCYNGGVKAPNSGGTAFCHSPNGNIVLPTLEVATSGIPKVVYCDRSSPDARCGKPSAKGIYATSQARYFEAWYNDDPKYNKRSSYEITLKKNSEGKFVYDASEGSSDSPHFAPLNDMRFVNTTLFPNPFDAPAWPNSFADFEDLAQPKRASKYWYTTELHTYFRYNSSRSLFEFSGDDDVWVFINDRLAVDLGGLHGVADGSVQLGDFADEDKLNLTEGQLYSLDMYHAERHYIQSNFKVTTTLTRTCNVAKSGSVAFNQSAAQSTDIFTGVTSDVVAQRENAIRLVPPGTAAYSSTFAFLRQQQNVGAGFVMSFKFAASSQGDAEGFAVVFHNRPEGLRNMPTSLGANLGIRYISNSFAIVFDMCADRAELTCSKQQVRLHYAPEGPEYFNEVSNDTLTVYDDVVRTLRYPGETHDVRIEYLETPDWLEVYIDGSLYLRKKDFSVEDRLGGRDAFVGFTASTSANPASIELTDLVITTVSVNPGKSRLDTSLAPANTTVSAPADGESLALVSFTTFDLCNNAITYGGFADMVDAVFVEQPFGGSNASRADRRFLAGEDGLVTYANGSATPAIIPALIIDNGDGSYAAGLATTLPGSFSLYLCFGAGCSVNVSLVESYNLEAIEGFMTADVDFITPDEANSFVLAIDDAVVIDALTAAPTFAPTELGAIPQPDNSETIKWAAVGGGSALFLFLLAALVVIRNRRKWRRDKAFIESGKLYNLDKDLTYDKADEYGVVGRMLINTRAAIMRERAQTVKAPKASEINDLLVENEELKEQVRVNKMHSQVAASGKPRAATPAAPPRRRFDLDRQAYE